jgi:predicted dehydrogenase
LFLQQDRIISQKRSYKKRHKSMLKGCVIGFGRMGVTHYSILNTHPDVRFVAVCDSQSALLKAIRRYQGVETFSDYRQMFGNVEIDFAILCTPTSSHTEIGLAAADKGIHLFLEKPFSLDPKAGSALAKKMRSVELVNQVGYFLRFHSVFRAVKEILEEGLIGTPSFYQNEMYGRTVLKPSKTSWRARKNMGGGCMMDFGSHCLDLSDYLFGPVAEVKGSVLKSIFSTEVEDAFFTHLIHEEGVIGSVSVNWSDESYRRPYNRIEIVGTKGKLVADRQEMRLYLTEEDPKGRYSKGWNVRYLPQLEKGARFIVRGPEFTEQLDHFVSCIRSPMASSLCTFEDALRTDKVMAMIREDL